MNNLESSIPLLKLSEAFQVLHEKAHEFVLDKQEFLALEYGFGQYDRYSLDKSISAVHFYAAEALQLSMKYEVLGQYDHNGIWTWAWANPDSADSPSEKLEIIRSYGEFYDFEPLTLAQCKAELPQVWAIAAVSAYLSGAQGIFRLQQTDNDQFIFFTEIIQ